MYDRDAPADGHDRRAPTIMHAPPVLAASVTFLLLAGVHAAEPSYEAPGGLHTGSRARVRKLTPDSLQHAVVKHRRCVVLMYGSGEAARVARGFQPWLYAIANMIPHVPVGTIDVSDDGASDVAEAFKVDADAMPQVKLLVRDNPKGKRVIDYRGPLNFESLLNWAHAAINLEEHELSAYGSEPENAQHALMGDDAKSGSNGGGGAGRAGILGAMGKLPESVRAMAQTMVRETRLQRILKQQGGGRVEQYDAMVGERYRALIEEEQTDLGDKYQVQEANRRARDAVREELMKDAPLHIKEEIEADVSLGDAANQMSGGGIGGGAGGGGGGNGKKAKKRKPPKTGPNKVEL